MYKKPRQSDRDRIDELTRELDKATQSRDYFRTRAAEYRRIANDMAADMESRGIDVTGWQPTFNQSEKQQ